MSRMRSTAKETMLIIGLAAILPLCTSCSNPQGPQSHTDSTSKFRSGKPYQATYTLARGEERIYWDGSGRVRLDIGAGGNVMPRMINIADLDKHESTAWAEGTNATKFYTRGPSRRSDPLLMMVYPTVKPSPADSLGAKNVDGHNCHGWKGGLNGESQIWLDDDCGCMVELTQGGNTMKLTSFSAQAPSASVFQPPADYTQATEASSLGGKRSGGIPRQLR
jgi:hypothetical protein